MSFFEDEETRSDDEEEQLTAAPEEEEEEEEEKEPPKKKGGRRTTTINKGDQFPALRIPADRPNGGNRNTPPIVNDGYSGDNFMEITTVSGVNIKKAVDSVITLLTSASLQFGSDGVRILGKDIGGAAISSIFFKRSAFQLYHCQQPVKFGLDIVEFNKLLSIVNRCPKLSFILDKADSDLQITMSGKTVQFLSRIKSVDLANGDMDDIPDHEYDLILKMSSQEFYDTIKYFNQLSEVVLIGTNMSVLRLCVQADSAEIDVTINPEVSTEDQEGPSSKDDQDDSSKKKRKRKTQMTFLKPAATDPSPDDDGFTVETYALKYLNAFTRATNMSSSVMMFFEPDKPMVLVYDVGNEGSITFVLSPVKRWDD